MGVYDETKAINGTYGEVFLDGAPVREATALQANISLDFLDVPMCGDLAKHRKVSGSTGTGTLEMTKVNSRMAILLSEMIKAGKTPSFTIISKLADPDSYGAERVVLKNVQFDSLTLADWQSNTIGKVTQNFSFTDWEYLDMIDPR